MSYGENGEGISVENKSAFGQKTSFSKESNFSGKL